MFTKINYIMYILNNRHKKKFENGSHYVNRQDFSKILFWNKTNVTQELFIYVCYILKHSSHYVNLIFCKQVK